MIDNAIRTIINDARKTLETIKDPELHEIYQLSVPDGKILEVLKQLLIVSEALFAKVRILDGFHYGE